MAEDLRAELSREVLKTFGLLTTSAENIIEAASTITTSYSKLKFTAKRADLQIIFFSWLQTIIAITCIFFATAFTVEAYEEWSIYGPRGILMPLLNAVNILAVFIVTAAYYACTVFKSSAESEIRAAREEFNLVSLKLLTQTLRTIRQCSNKRPTSRFNATSGHENFNMFERIIKTCMGFLGIIYLGQAINIKDLIYGLGAMLNLRALFPPMTIFNGYGYDEGMTVQGFLAMKWVQFMEKFFHFGTSVILYIPYKFYRFFKRMFTSRRIDTDNPDDDGVQLDEHWFRVWQDKAYKGIKDVFTGYKYYGPTLSFGVILAGALYYWKNKYSGKKNNKRRTRFSPLAIVSKKEAEEVKERPSDEPRTWDESQVTRSMSAEYTDDIPTFDMLTQCKGDLLSAPKGTVPTVAIPGSPVFKNILRVMHSMLQIGSMYAGSSFITGNFLVTAGHCLTSRKGKLGLWVRDPLDPETWLWCPLAREFKSTLAGGYTDSIAACHLHHKLANIKRVTVVLPEEHGPISVPVWIQGQQSTWGVASGNYRKCYEYNPVYLVLTATIHAGTSGAPVFDTNGAVVGIVSCECEATEENFALGFTPEIIAFLREEHSVSVEESPPMDVASGSRPMFTSTISEEESSTETDEQESDTNGQRQTKKKSSKKSSSMNGNQTVPRKLRSRRGKGQGQKQKQEKEPPAEDHGSDKYPSIITQADVHVQEVN